MARRRDDPHYRQISAYIHQDLAERLDIQIVKERRPKQELIEEAILLYLEKYEGDRRQKSDSSSKTGNSSQN